MQGKIFLCDSPKLPGKDFSFPAIDVFTSAGHQSDGRSGNGPDPFPFAWPAQRATLAGVAVNAMRDANGWLHANYGDWRNSCSAETWCRRTDTATGVHLTVQCSTLRDCFPDHPHSWSPEMTESLCDNFEDAWMPGSKDALLSILGYADRLLRNLSIDYGVHSGAALAIVRHNGTLIPWDDDVDIYMQNKNVARFAEHVQYPYCIVVFKTPWVQAKVFMCDSERAMGSDRER